MRLVDPVRIAGSIGVASKPGIQTNPVLEAEKRLLLKKPFHPFLFAIYPILFLYAQNVEEFTLHVLFGPLLISLLITSILSIIILRFTGNPLRGLFVLSLFILFFFSYGHFHHFLENAGFLRMDLLGNPGSVLGLYGIFFLLLAWIGLRAVKDWSRPTRFWNLFSLALTFWSVLQIAFMIPQRPIETPVKAHRMNLPVTPQDPDIFYIILDGYPRDDVLRKLHQFDNSSLLRFLEHRGFHILNQSHSNYPGTSLSLASSLNYSYLDEFIPRELAGCSNRWLLTELIQNNRVLGFLRGRGYVTTAFDSGYSPTEMKKADQFYATGWFLDEFHAALLDTTPAWTLLKNLSRYRMQRKRILHILDQLPEVRNAVRPVFVFAHIMALHPPFVFGPNGEEKKTAKDPPEFGKEFGAASEQVVQDYKDQLTFINKKVQQTVTDILATRQRPVVIVLQGDHGSSFLSERDPYFYSERFSILNAIRLPQQQSQIYDSMSPVNSFRVIFNSYFGTNLKLLEDRSYYSVRSLPYRFSEVTHALKQDP